MNEAPTSGRPKKRVSFLMPYIDFCFMLIIIFIGMLSIAYFEPLGTTDIETQETKKIDNLEGEFIIKPSGIQKQNIGVGQQKMSSELRPLEGSGQIRALVAPQKKTGKGEGGESTVAGPGGGRQLGRGDEPQLVIELEKKLKEKQAELESLKKQMAKLEAEKTAQTQTVRKDDRKSDENIEENQQRKIDKINTGGPVPQDTQQQGKGDHFYLDLREKE